MGSIAVWGADARVIFRVLWCSVLCLGCTDLKGNLFWIPLNSKNYPTDDRYDILIMAEAMGHTLCAAFHRSGRGLLREKGLRYLYQKAAVAWWFHVHVWPACFSLCYRCTQTLCTITAHMRHLCSESSLNMCRCQSGRSTSRLRVHSLSNFNIYNTQNIKAYIVFVFPFDLLTLEWISVSFTGNFTETSPNVPLSISFVFGWFTLSPWSLGSIV